MTSQFLKTVLLTVIAVVLALLLLVSMINGDFSPLIGSIILCLVVLLTLKGSFGLCLALATTCPVLISLPFARGIPAPALALLFCGGACALRKAILASQEPPALKAFDIWVLIFYVYLFARYAVNPVKPGYALGMGQDMTGFRSWADHLIGCATIFLSGFLLNSRSRMNSFFKVYFYSSCGFAVIMMGLMFVTSERLTVWLEDAGMFAAFFSNGLRRFVGLPQSGLVMISAGLFPALFPLRPSWRFIVSGLGILAIVAGGNRSSFIALLTLIVVVLLMRRKYVLLGFMFGIMLFTVFTVKVLNVNQVIASDNPFVRVFGLFNQEIDESSGGTSTAEWRLLRWNQAWMDIQEHPFWGVGYSGIKGYFSLISDFRYNSSELDLDRDLASGSTHNGYLSAARAFGIPITLVFIYILIRQIVRHFRAAHLARGQDAKLFETHLFLCCTLLNIAEILMMSGEIRQIGIWMFLAVSFLVFQLDSVDQVPTEANG